VRALTLALGAGATTVLSFHSVSAETEETSRVVPFDEAAQAVFELSGKGDLAGLLSRFQERLKEWCAPSAVLAATKDPAAEGGWRLLGPMCQGSGPLGAERSIRQLLEDVPEGLTRPTVVRPQSAFPGARPRENCVVPWEFDGQSGLLVLRGIAESRPSNLASAVALLAMAVWPRLLGGPAGRVEASITELRRMADRLREDAERELERLRAGAAAAPGGPAPGPVDPERLRSLERQLLAAKEDAEREAGARGELDEKLKAVGDEKGAALARIAAAEQAAEKAREQLAAAETARASVELRLATTERRKAELEDRLSAVEKSRTEALQKLAAAEKARAGAEEQLSAAGKGRPDLEERLAAAERAKADVDERLAAAARAAAATESQLTAVAKARAEAEGQRAMAERARADLEDKIRGLEEAASATPDAAYALKAQKELNDTRDEAQRLRLERQELEQQVTTLEKALGEAEEERDQARREAEKARAGGGVAAPPREAGEKAAADGGPSPAGETMRRVLAVLRRTPFLPPEVRVSAQEAQALLSPAGEDRKAPRMRVALLDRDAGSLAALADELEQNGIDVKVASHPEELALLLKTPEGRGLNAAVCDVLAFRPDQNVAGIFRSWEKDRPGLGLFLSFAPDSTAEVERAQRVPASLTAGRFQRPLKRPELVEMLEPVLRRQGQS
jgi:hypothetical protein